MGDVIQPDDGRKTRSSFHVVSGIQKDANSNLSPLSYPWLEGAVPSAEQIQQAEADYAAYRHQWALCSQTRLETTFPTNVDVELSSRCNLRCQMCQWGLDSKNNPLPTELTQFQSFRQSPGYISGDLFRQIINEAVREGAFSVKLGWRGEPLMNPDAIEHIIYAKRMGVRELLLNTNGTFLTESLSQRLVTSGIDIVAVSIDSIRKDRFETIRKGAVLSEVLQNIETLVRLRDENRTRTGYPKPLIRAQMVLMDENADEVEEFQDYLSRIVDSVAIKEYNNRGERTDRLTKATKPVGRKACPQLWQRLQVAHDGTVAMCCQDWDMYNPFGKLAYPETTLASIWRGEKREETKALHEERRLDEIPGCRTCKYVESFLWSDD